MPYLSDILNGAVFIVTENLPELKMSVAPLSCPHLHCYLPRLSHHLPPGQLQ